MVTAEPAAVRSPKNTRRGVRPSFRNIERAAAGFIQIFDHLIQSVFFFHISDTLIDHGIECSSLFRIEASPAFRRQLFSVI